jgi:hypothetical protein
MAGLAPFESTSIVEKEEPKGFAPFEGTTVVGEEEEDVQPTSNVAPRMQNAKDLEEKRESKVPEALKDNPFQYLDENTDLIGTETKLPDPNTTMYDDLVRAEGSADFIGGEQFKKAVDRYNFYKNHPDSERTLTGKVVYNNKVVPYPEQSMAGNMKVKAPQLVAGGFRNTGINLLELGETATDLVGITDPETTYVKDNFAKLDPGGSTVDSLLIEGTGLLTGGGLAAKGGQALLKQIPKLKDSKYANAIVGFMGFDVGVAATANSDADTLAIGNKAMLNKLGIQPKIFEGISINEDDPKAKQEMAKRVNILLDGLGAAGVVMSGIKAATFVGRTMHNIFVKPLTDAGSINAMEEDYVRDLLDVLVNVGDEPEAIEAARLSVIKLIEDNKNLYVDVPEDMAAKVDVTVDTMTALERALSNNNTDEARKIIMKAQGAKKGVIQGANGSNQTAINAARPTVELDRVLNEAEVNLGGGDAIDQTNKALQDQGLAEVDDAALGVVKAEENLANLNETIVRELTEDPSIIGKVTDLEKKTGFDVGSVRENSADEIVANLSKASEEMDAVKNDLFNRIEGGAVDYDSLIDTLQSLKPQQLDSAASAMPGDDLFGTLLEQTKLQTRTDPLDGTVITETVEEMQERFASWATESGLDFAKLFTEIRPSLVDSINRLEFGSSAEKGAAKTLIKFKKWIDEDAVDFIKTGERKQTTPKSTAVETPAEFATATKIDDNTYTFTRDGIEYTVTKDADGGWVSTSDGGIEIIEPTPIAEMHVDIVDNVLNSANPARKKRYYDYTEAKADLRRQEKSRPTPKYKPEVSANPELVEAVDEAMDYFKNQWAPFWDDGSTLQQIGSLRRQTVARGKQGPKFEDEARQAVKGTINDDNRSVAANMVKLLERPEAGESAPLVTDYIIGDVLSTLSSRLDTTEKLSDLGLDAVRQGLSRYSTLLRQNFGQEADRLDALVNRLSDTKLTKEQLQREIIQAQRLADEAQDRIFTKELNGFFTAQGVRNPNGYNTLEKIFNNQQSADRITELMARAEGDPIIEAGMQAAYTRWFRNNYLGTSTSTAGDRTMKLSVEKLNEEGVKNAFEYANIVFKNRPEFVGALDTLLKESGLVQRSRASKAIPTDSGTAALTDQIAAVNRGITATLGVLSRVGARIRAGATGFLQQNFAKQTYFNMVDNLMANPDEFIRVAQRVVDKDKATNNDALYRMALYAGVYREDNEENKTSFFEALAQTELDFTRARDEFVQSQELGLE